MRLVGIAIALVWCAGLVRIAEAAPRQTITKPAKQVTAKKKTKRPVAKRWQRRGAVTPKSRFEIEDTVNSTAYHYANLSAKDCEAELVARKIPFVRESWAGVRGGVRLTGPLRGVEFRTNLRDSKRATTPWEVGDCRLILALDDFAEILASHDVVDVRHYSMHRLVPKSWPEGKQATRHMGGVAIDAARFILRDGSYLDVDKHFNGRIGAPTCGEKAAPYPATPEALKLRAILCEAVARRIFTVVLTPNYNRPHKNHFHLEVTEGVKWFLVH